jgi:hypothetical protein
MYIDNIHWICWMRSRNVIINVKHSEMYIWITAHYNLWSLYIFCGWKILRLATRSIVNMNDFRGSFPGFASSSKKAVDIVRSRGWGLNSSMLEASIYVQMHDHGMSEITSTLHQFHSVLRFHAWGFGAQRNVKAPAGASLQSGLSWNFQKASHLPWHPLPERVFFHL